MRTAWSLPTWIQLSALLATGCAGALELPTDRVTRAGRTELAQPKEIVVIAESSAAMLNLSRKAVRAGYAVSGTQPLDGLGLLQTVVVIPRGQSPEAAIRELEAMDPSITAGLNHGYVAEGAEGASGRRRFAQRLLRWSGEACTARAPIGLIDTPLDLAHPALARATILQADVTRQGAVAAPAAHGTHMATLLTDPTMLSGSALYHASAVYTTDDGKSQASVDTLMRALDWMAGSNVRIVTISLSGPYNKILDKGVNRAIDKGLIIIAAVGNEGALASPRYPAAFKRVIAVTALDADMRIYSDAVQGAHIDFSAPGVELSVEGINGPEYVTGTSFAATFVALRLAADERSLRETSADGVKSQLARDVIDLGTDGPDPTFGTGMIVAPPDCRMKS